EVICTIRLVRHLIFKKIDVMFFLYYHFFSPFYLALLSVFCRQNKIAEGGVFIFIGFSILYQF
ncbi:hypothetical protein, partial [Escherichia coli]|uniref:hypothetical protein n=1 Tax=Escherichia coli TaxID=562 RepID=UPI001E4C8688